MDSNHKDLGALPNGTGSRASTESLSGVSAVPASIPSAAEPYENRLSVDQLRREARRCWNDEAAFEDDIAELPEVPSLGTMRLLAGAGMKLKWPDTWSLGKQIQREHPYGTVPCKTEYECAVGLWSVLRAGILASGIAARSDETAKTDSAGGKSPPGRPTQVPQGER